MDLDDITIEDDDFDATPLCGTRGAYEFLGEGFTACVNDESCRWEIDGGKIVVSRRTGDSHLYKVAEYRLGQKKEATEFCRGFMHGVLGAF